MGWNYKVSTGDDNIGVGEAQAIYEAMGPRVFGIRGAVLGGGKLRKEQEGFFFNDTTTTEIYTLALRDALPISDHARGRDRIDGAPPVGLEGGWTTAWVAAGLLLMTTASTVFCVPYGALGAEPTTNHHDRPPLFPYQIGRAHL